MTGFYEAVTGISYTRGKEKYTYKNHKASPYRMNADEIIGHQAEWRKRECAEFIGYSYQAKCTCGWKDNRWQPFAAMKRTFQAHVGSIENGEQLELF